MLSNKGQKSIGNAIGYGNRILKIISFEQKLDMISACDLPLV